MLKRIKFNHFTVLFIVLSIFIVSCSGTKNLGEGELLYTGATIKIEDSLLSKKDKKQIKETVEDLTRPKPNKSFFGIRPEIFFYNLAGEVKKEKGFRYWLKYKVGKAPVLFSEVDLDFNSKVIQNNLENNGYFKSRTSYDSVRKGKTAKAEYILKPNKQFKINKVIFESDSSLVANEIRVNLPKSILQPEKPYSLENIKLERARLDAKLKEKGFYYFNEDYLLVQVDSTVGNYKTDLILKIKDETPERAKIQYSINKVFVYPNYQINNDTIPNSQKEIIQYKDFTIIDNNKLFKPQIFDRTLYFKKGDLYNRTNHNLSLNRLITLGTFKFVKNKFEVNDSLKNSLDAYYYLTPLPKKSIRVEVLGKTNSANYTGTELNINWSNRNTFKGAELLSISAFGGVEVQVSGQNNGFNVYRFGGEASLVWPRFITPFKLKSSSGFVPKTKALVNYEYQLRSQLYTLQTLNGTFGYIWKENVRKEHELKVVNVTYADSQNVSDLYLSQIAENSALGKVIEKQLIFGPSYSYTYTNTMLKNKKNTIYYKGSLDTSGNVAGLLLGANDPNNPKKILEVPFSQFVKLESDFRHYLNLGGETQLASRIIVGTGFAYGNSIELPYIKQFFIGGTNSIRAFRARSIGPGSFIEKDNPTKFLPDQSGDVKLELNTEFRGKIYSFVKGALFVDAGNIWLLKEDSAKPGAAFSGNFLDDLAVGVGAGLRFDFSFLVLRTDFAFPLRKPYLEGNNKWVINQINFGSGPWRSENLIFNLAIGYPF